MVNSPVLPVLTSQDAVRRSWSRDHSWDKGGMQASRVEFIKFSALNQRYFVENVFCVANSIGHVYWLSRHCG